MKVWLVSIFFMGLMSLPASAQTCAVLKAGAQEKKAPAELIREAAPSLASGEYKLVFFATWCSACKISLTAKKDKEPVILIGTMDERPRIERAYQLLGEGRPCLVDEDGVLMRKLGAKELPFTTRVKL